MPLCATVKVQQSEIGQLTDFDHESYLPQKFSYGCTVYMYVYRYILYSVVGGLQL